MNTIIRIMYIIIYFLLMHFVMPVIAYDQAEQKNFIIITASYNNKDWYQRNLESVFKQTYPHWHMFYINDCSTDGTGEYVQNFIQQQGMQDKVTLINNMERLGHLANQYGVINGCPKNSIIVIVDGDDWLAHNNVLHYLNTIYQDKNVWMTYGQFWYFKRNTRGLCRTIPQEYIQKNAIREYPTWVLSHLRTFYAGLFQMIKYEDLLYQGNFYPMSADVAVMYPMFEMAAERARFISEVLCIYNDANQLCFFHDNREKQKEIRQHICDARRYNRLESPIFLQER